MGPLRAVTLALFLASIMAAGCIEAPPPCEGEECPTRGGLVPGWGVLDTVQFQSCTGVVGNADRPLEDVRVAVPSAFDVQGYADVTGILLFEAYTCQRVVASLDVDETVHLAKVAAFVEPVNQTWSSASTQYYVLNFLTSSSSLSKVLGRAVPSDVARFRVEGVAPSLFRWTIEADDCRIEFDLPHAESRSSTVTGSFANWGGAGPYALVEETKSYQALGLPTGSTLRAEGACASAQALGSASAVQVVPQAVDASWKLTNQSFG